MAEKKLIIELQGSDNLGGRSGAGGKAGAGGPDGSSDSPIRAKKVSKLEESEIIAKKLRERNPNFDVDKLTRKELLQFSKSVFQTAENSNKDKAQKTAIPTVGSMDDLDSQLGDFESEADRKERIKRLRRQRRVRRRWNRRNKRIEREKAKQLADQEKEQEKQRKEEEKANKERLAAGTKRQSIVAGGLRQTAVNIGGGRAGAVVGAAQTFAKMFGATVAGPLSIAVGGVAVAALASAAAMGALVVAAKKFDSAIMESANTLKDLNASVASAMNARDLMQLQSQINRSNIIGEDQARYIMGRSGIEMQLEDIKTQILARFLPIAIELMPTLSQYVDSAGSVVDRLLELPWDKVFKLIEIAIESNSTFIETWDQVLRWLEQTNLSAIWDNWLREKQKDKAALKDDLKFKDLLDFLNVTYDEAILEGLVKKHDTGKGDTSIGMFDTLRYAIPSLLGPLSGPF